MALNFEAFEKLGYSLNFVSNQKEQRSNSLARQFNPNIHFINDERSAFSKSLGLLDKKGLPLGLEVFGFRSDVIYPAVIVTDEKGFVRYFDVTDNYRDRPEVNTILSELEQLNSSNK